MIAGILPSYFSVSPTGEAEWVSDKGITAEKSLQSGKIFCSMKFILYVQLEICLNHVI